MGIFSLIRPLRKYVHYVDKANFYDSLLLRKKAIETMKNAINQPFTIKERASCLWYLGILNLKMKEFKLASEYFHQSLELVSNEQIKYRSNFKVAIETFIKNGEKQRALFWLDNLLERQSYDKRFSKLSYLKKYLS